VCVYVRVCVYKSLKITNLISPLAIFKIFIVKKSLHIGKTCRKSLLPKQDTIFNVNPKILGSQALLLFFHYLYGCIMPKVEVAVYDDLLARF
jgi:hypothetical protein